MFAPSEIDRIRRFHRAVTRETGVMDQSFLGRGRPLGAARVLNAIGRGTNEVAAIRDYLGLDSGLMSRLLRGLEDEGLVATSAVGWWCSPPRGKRSSTHTRRFPTTAPGA